MVIFPLAPDQTIAQMWSNGARGGQTSSTHMVTYILHTVCQQCRAVKLSKVNIPINTL